ncbi:alginate lyase-domain-containing protein [Rhizophagus clarus]|uniref:Alginate lyase-domain-containing protein n=1 Tax=Rhizophagus clarus TaxID=94130 RepID=A0A8H3QV54_9GLOM|nr:alginate lyase-domain-containing protein [Rhizophagus clarus]
MNPNLNYAGFRRGDNIGRRTGVLDIRPVFKMLQSISLMRSSPKWNFVVEKRILYLVNNFPIGIKAKEDGLNNHALVNRINIGILPSGEQPLETKEC